MIKQVRNIIYVLIFMVPTMVLGQDLEKKAIGQEERAKNATSFYDGARQGLATNALFLKFLLTGSETYNWFLEAGISSSASGTALMSMGTAGINSGTASGVATGVLQLGAGLASTQIWPGIIFLFGELVLAGVLEEHKDRVVKSAQRLGALASLGKIYPGQGNLEQDKFQALIEKSNRGRTKYRCKRTKAIAHAREEMKEFTRNQKHDLLSRTSQRIRQKFNTHNSFFCISGNAVPMDYLCEFLAQIPQADLARDAIIGGIANIFKNPMVSAYRKNLKYRFLDQYYTAINDDFEGIVKIRSAVNIADRLNASEFWEPDSETNLLNILHSMQGTSPLMQSLNACRKNKCDERNDQGSSVSMDNHSTKPYANYCEYYFRKSPISHFKRMSFDALINKVSENLSHLASFVDSVDVQKQMQEQVQSMENMGKSAASYQSIIQKDNNEMDRQKLLSAWESDPQNRDMVAAINHLKEQGDVADQDEKGAPK